MGARPLDSHPTREAMEDDLPAMQCARTGKSSLESQRNYRNSLSAMSREPLPDSNDRGDPGVCILRGGRRRAFILDPKSDVEGKTLVIAWSRIN